MQRVNVMQSRCLGEGEIASLSANFVLRKERQTCCLGKGDRDSAAWRQSAETQKRPVMLLPSVDDPYCLLFLAKCFLDPQGLLSTMNSRKRTPQRTGQGQRPTKTILPLFGCHQRSES